MGPPVRRFLSNYFHLLFMHHPVCRMTRMRTMARELVESGSRCRKTSPRRKAGYRGETLLIISRTSASVHRWESSPSRRASKYAVSWRWFPRVTTSRHQQLRMTRMSVHHSRLYISSDTSSVHFTLCLHQSRLVYTRLVAGWVTVCGRVNHLGM